MTCGPDHSSAHLPVKDLRCAVRERSFFIFLFLFSFFTKIYFRFRNLQEYTPAAPLLGDRDLVAPQGFLCKNFCKNICAQVPGGRSPGSGVAGLGRPAAGRPALPPSYKGWLVPPPLIYITKIPETKKKEGGRERGEVLLDFRAGDCR